MGVSRGKDTTLSSCIMYIWAWPSGKIFDITKTHDFQAGKDTPPHLYLGVSVPLT